MKHRYCFDIILELLEKNTKKFVQKTGLKTFLNTNHLQL